MNKLVYIVHIFIYLFVIFSCTQKNSDKVYNENSDTTQAISHSLIIGNDSTSLSFRDSVNYPNIQISFIKNKDSAAYSTLRISNYYYQANIDTSFTLEYLSEQLSTIWAIVEMENKISLTHVSVGYPLEYTDVLINQIEAFKNSPQWQPHLYESKLWLDYELIKATMLEADVYKPLNNFLKTKGFHISGFHLEKHGYVTKNKLEELGYDTNMMIPVPFIVWIDIREL